MTELQYLLVPGGRNPHGVAILNVSKWIVSVHHIHKEHGDIYKHCT